MTMHADQLVGAPVLDAGGRGMGTVEQVFRDDVDGRPSWARIRSAKGLHFVPLAGGKVTGTGGLIVAYDESKILSEPGINVDRHMSVEQEEELRQYFGLSVPPQAAAPEASRAEAGQAGGPGPGSGPGSGPGPGPGQTQPNQARLGEPTASRSRPAGETRADRQPAPAPATDEPGQPGQPGQQWMIRSEERFSVNLETQEASRVRMRKYVETEPVEQTIKVFHEEYEIERVPIANADQVRADLAEGEQEIILREARAIITKESVPVERIRLTTRKVEEDRTIRDELRRERIEVIDAGGQAEHQPGQSQPGQSQPASSPGQPSSPPSPGQPPSGPRPPSGQPPSGQPRR